MTRCLSLPFWIGIATLLATAASGCAHRLEIHPLPPPDSVRGSSSAQFVIDPENPAKDLPQNVELHPPLPRTELEVAVFPPRALAARAGPATVGVRFIVGVEGNVTGVARSPLVTTTSGPFEDEFRAAAEETVRKWVFEPAWLARFENGPDRDGDGKPDYRVAKTLDHLPVYLDVRIDFEIIEGVGKVRVSGMPDRR